MKEEEKGLDAIVSDLLSNVYSLQSRRSFVQRLTKAVFAMTGITILDILRPITYDTQKAHAQGSPGWEGCAGDGVICDASCGCWHESWVQGGHWDGCCQDPSNGCWYRVTYTDFCGGEDPGGQANCVSLPSAQFIWCAQAGQPYRCTQVQVDGTS